MVYVVRYKRIQLRTILMVSMILINGDKYKKYYGRHGREGEGRGVREILRVNFNSMDDFQITFGYVIRVR